MSEVDFGRNPFEFSPGEPFSTLKLVGDLTPDLAKEYEKRLKPKIDSLSTDLLLDLSETGTIHPLWTRPLMQIATQVKKIERRLRVAAPNPIHRAFLQDQGIAASFPLSPDPAAAARDLTEKKAAKLDVSFINPFLEGTVEILKKAAGVAAKPGPIAAKDPADPLDGEISGLIDLDSDRFLGSVVLSFPEKTYLSIVSRMLGESHEAITSENRDAVSEIANLVFGYAKRKLSEKGHRIKMALPTILSGKTPDGLPSGTGPRISVPFESEVGPFSVEIRVRSR